MATTQKRTWVITGSSRGLGLELVKQLAANPSNIIYATCRNPETATELMGITTENVKTFPLDIMDKSSIQQAATILTDELGEAGTIDYLINNAGFQATDSVFDLDPQTLLNHVECHVIGPMLLTNALLPFVERSQRKVIMNMSSGMASLGAAIRPGIASYSIAKCAQNMLTLKQSMEKPNVIFIAMAPGWVNTELGGPMAPLRAPQSIAGVIKVLEGATLEHSGKYMMHDGGQMPW